MKKLKAETVCRHVLANVAIAIFIAIVALMGVSLKNQALVSTANKEYNGTIYAGDKNSNNISIMINVYWNTDELKQMLEILEAENIKTTFFVGAAWAKDEPELLKTMIAAGHEIGNHGTNHKEHGKISYEKNLSEIQTCHELVKTLTGVQMELFAPPGGSYSSLTTKAAEFLGYKTIMWTRDTIDWRDKNTDLIVSRATTNMSGGDLILMHPTKNSVEALPKIIAHAKAKNLSVVPVSQTLGL